MACSSGGRGPYAVGGCRPSRLADVAKLCGAEVDTGGHDLDAVAGRVAAELLAHSHLVEPDRVAETLAEIARPLGVSRARIYLADLQRRYLRALPGGNGRPPEVLGIDSTIAGHAFRMVRVHHRPADGSGHGHRVWLPLMDGSERLGVLELTAADVSEPMLARYGMVASLAGLLIMSKSLYSDTYAEIRRGRDMALQAEMIWAFLAPTTFMTERVLVAATLEPAYEVGGDAFDYSLMGDRLHVSIFDAATIVMVEWMPDHPHRQTAPYGP